MFSKTELFAGTWSWRSCVPREGQADVAICTPCCCGWRDKDRQSAFDFAFGLIYEYLDVLRTLTLKGKAFHVFSVEKWSNELRLIKGCYSGQENLVSKLLKVGAPAEISPLFTLKTVSIPHHARARGCLLGLCALYWRLVLSGWLRSRRRSVFWNVGDCSESRNVMTCCHFIILSFFFVRCKCDLWNVFPAKSPNGRSVWQHATRDKELWQTCSKCHGGLSGVLFWRCGLVTGSLSRRVLTGLGSPVRSRKGKKNCCSVLIRRAPVPKKCADSDSGSRDGPSLSLLGCAFAIDSLLFCLSFLLEWMPVCLCRCWPVDVQWA